MKYTNPLNPMPSVPTDGPGSFGAVRKFDIHSGIDLYTPELSNVFAMEDGVVVNVERFTGDSIGMPWWNETDAVYVEGKSGVIVYGEVAPCVQVGYNVKAGDIIGNVMTVLKKDKGRPMSMLHLEFHKHGTTKTTSWELNESKPDTCLNPIVLFENIDWVNYNSQFPDRYTSQDKYFDSWLFRLASEMRDDISVLDVGCGVNGTKAIQKFSNKSFLDPFIDNIDGYKKVSFENPFFHQSRLESKYDLIVLRGCINYLSPTEILILSNSLNPRGMLLANTFSHPTTGEREFIKDGVVGKEVFTYDKTLNKILHVLTIGDIVARHSFNYYTIRDYMNMIGPDVQAAIHSKNSVLLKFTR